MPTITIDDRIVEYSQEMLPAYFDILYFIQKHMELYNAFATYQGVAKKEIEEYADKQLQQMGVLGQGYNALAEDLQKIVMSFLKFDDEKARFYEGVSKNMSSDVRKSLGM